MREEQTPHGVSAKSARVKKRLRTGTVDLDLLVSEPIAIVGMGCRFPGGADDPAKFWEMLCGGVDGIRKIPDGRWPDPKYEEFGFPEHLRYGGYLEQIDGFDAAFFGTAPRDAPNIDPQQRLLLEVTWEALWDAGIEPAKLSGEAAGVFAGIGNSDYLRISLQHVEQPGAPNGVNSIHSVAAGRISYLLNLSGPCIALDSACSSSLVTTHLACQSLRAGECDLALSGGVSLKALPDEMFVLNRLRALSKSSRCRSFDAKADGFVVGEGCGMIVLKRLQDAVRDGDRIRGVIRGSAVNHDGRTAVLTSPNGLAQEAVMRQALENGEVDPAAVSYIETHGTATPKGDPVELRALHSVYGARSEEAGACILGAVKSNLGHLEAAAGVAGIIKTVLALEHESIPKNLHFTHANPGHWIEGTRLKLAEQQETWPRGGRPRRAGVSSFGIGGTNAHLVLEEAPALSGEPCRSPLKPHVWERRRYWVDTKGAPARRNSRAAANLTVNGVRLRSPFLRAEVIEFVLDAASAAYLEGHGFSGEPMLFRNGLMELVRIAAKQAPSEKNIEALDAVLFDAVLKEPLSVASSVKVQVSIGDGRIEVVSEGAGGWTTHLSTVPLSDKRSQDADASRASVTLPEQSDSRESVGASPEKGPPGPEVFDTRLSLEQIAQRVQREAAIVMETTEAALPVDEPLINLGMDSIMAMELQNRLQAFIPQQLPVNLAFAYPSIDDLAKWIRARLWAANKGDANGGDSGATPAEQMEEVEI